MTADGGGKEMLVGKSAALVSKAVTGDRHEGSLDLFVKDSPGSFSKRSRYHKVGVGRVSCGRATGSPRLV